MGFVKSLLGSSSGAGFKAKGTSIDSPVDAGQAGNATYRSQNALDRQSAFVNQMREYTNAPANQEAVFGQQMALSNQLADQAAGLGPNPVMAQLNQTTGQNVANQAALMAGQRGASANAGLMARQAANQGAGLQQQAVGQAATLGAQQQLNAQQALSGHQAQMAALAGTQVNQQQQALNSLNQGSQGLQSNLMNAIGAQNSARVNMQSNMNSANAGIAAENAKTQGGMLGGALSGVGGALGSVVGLAHGGEVPGYADGGRVAGPSSAVGRYFHEGKNASPASVSKKAPAILAAKGGHVPGKANVKGDSSKNDTVPAMLSPGEVVIPRHVMQSKNAPKMAAEFVRQIMAKKGKAA